MAAGVLRGAGKQLIGALCNLVGFYCIGFPTGVSLMFAAKMGIVGKTQLIIRMTMSGLLLVSKHLEKTLKLFSDFCVGLWTGLTIAMSLVAIVFITVLCKLNWKKAAKEVGKYITLHLTLYLRLYPDMI